MTAVRRELARPPLWLPGLWELSGVKAASGSYTHTLETLLVSKSHICVWRGQWAGGVLWCGREPGCFLKGVAAEVACDMLAEGSMTAVAKCMPCADGFVCFLVFQNVMNKMHTVSVPYSVMKTCPLSWVQRVHAHKGNLTHTHVNDETVGSMPWGNCMHAHTHTMPLLEARSGRERSSSSPWRLTKFWSCY